MYCKFFSKILFSRSIIVLIVAKCIVNQASYAHSYIHWRINSSKVYCKFFSIVVNLESFSGINSSKVYCKFSVLFKVLFFISSINSSKVYCKLNKGIISEKAQKVLIVAKCIVNYHMDICQDRQKWVLIVAKCIVNLISCNFHFKESMY